jgi:hypothetical protein
MTNVAKSYEIGKPAPVSQNAKFKGVPPVKLDHHQKLLSELKEAKQNANKYYNESHYYKTKCIELYEKLQNLSNERALMVAVKGGLL